MKFDFCIGNPPYQEETKDNGRQSPVYNRFMDEAYKIAECVELITPARFLFNAGQTPKEWNDKMLQDSHLKVLSYEANASKVFSNTEIKGGIAITMRDERKEYGEIGVFIEYDEMNGILNKVKPYCDKSIADICVRGVPYGYTDLLKKDHPELIALIGDSFDLRTNTFDKLYNKLFFEQALDSEYTPVYGIYNKKRTKLYIATKYLEVPNNYNFYKVILSKAQGSDKFGEALSEIIVGEKGAGHTQSFISMGSFEKENEAYNLKKYLKTRFARCLLSVLKKTQDITPYKWQFVPLQNFTLQSDIDWTKPILEIDQQLYKKYGLSQEEIDFIETNVKEME